ncbi:MAG: pyridoxal phosphate-dependent aminotransferase [Candidatus Onthomonas sp.]|nr:pyridoxal phosphate-dependent aminotransferase [Candidatus Onthomonas sp.]
MKSLSTIASNVQASTTLALDALYKEMKANGVDVIGFAAGEPDFPTPDYIKYAGMAAIVHDETRYTPATGTLALKKAVCKRLKEDLDLDYEPSNIVCSSGAKHCLYIALRAIINPGDEVIIPTPAWVTYNEMVKMVGAEPVTIVCTEAENFKLTPEKLEAAITDKTKCVMLNNPSNPTGMLYSREELQGIADVCVKHDLFIIADEIYYKLLYDGREFTSIASLGEDVKELTIIINGVSKSYAMTGWRIGYIAADKRVVSVMSKYLSHSTGNPSAPAQAASVAALNAPQDTVEEMRKAFEARRDYMVERMNQIPGVSCLKPQGAFYVMMNISKLIGKTLHGQVINNADDFGDIFLKEGLVCIVPCTGFGDPNFLRWSYATSMENIKEGLDRLERFLAE